MTQKKPKKPTLATASAEASAVSLEKLTSAAKATAALLAPPSTYELLNKNLVLSIRTLINPETDRSKLGVLEQLVLRRIQCPGANLLQSDHELGNKTPLDALKIYCKQNPSTQELQQLLEEWAAIERLTENCHQVLCKRWPNSSSLNFLRLYKHAKPAQEKYDNTLLFSLTCNHLEEARLVATMIEEVIKENYRIPYRSVGNHLPIKFKNKQDGTVGVEIYYTQPEYIKVLHHDRQFSLKIQDQQLMTCFYDRTKTINDYWTQSLKITNPNDFISPPPLKPRNDRHRFHKPQDTVLATKPLRLLFFTGTRVGLGNYINAARMIQGLSQNIPLEIDWVIEHGGQVLPKVELPESVRVHERDAFWKMVPLVQFLTEKAAGVISLPNDWLSACYNEVGEPVPKSYIVVDEYNCGLGDSPSFLCSGINAGPKSLGIIKPAELPVMPSTLSGQRQLISKDENAAVIFSKNPEAPCYFAYVALQCDNLKGVDAVSVLAMFIEHAKQSDHPCIKIVMPIHPLLIEESIKRYPNIFQHCTVSYIDPKAPKAITFGDKSRLAVDIYNCFPLENTTFRLMMNYAASCNTPIVSTGDQSLIEMFFSTQDECSFIYQLLDHKQGLFDAMRLIARENQLVALEKILARTENGLHSEEDITELVLILNRQETTLKAEFRTLRDIVKAQPDLVEQFSAVISEVFGKKPVLGAEKTEASSKKPS